MAAGRDDPVALPLAAQAPLPACSFAAASWLVERVRLLVRLVAGTMAWRPAPPQRPTPVLIVTPRALRDVSPTTGGRKRPSLEC